MSLEKLNSMWFHTIDEEGQIKYQGQIIEVFNDKLFLAQLYDYVVGMKNGLRLMNFENVTLEIYDTDKKMRDEYNRRNR